MNSLLSFEKIQRLTGGQWISKPVNPNAIVKGGAFDTRSLGDAQIFFAWKGETSDGHNYLPQLVDSSIQLIIVEKNVAAVSDIAILQVKDSLLALQQMAHELIKGFQGKIVNITGSSGKTTSKEWLKHLINGHRKLLTNIGSFNNHIGCPITILNMVEDHDLVVLEMGTSGLGEIEQLTAMAPSDIALLLNVGHAHLGMFGNRDHIYQAKLELFNHMKPGGIALLPAFDDRLKQVKIEGRKQLFGKGAETFGWSREGINPRERSQTLRFNTPWGSKTITVFRLGEYVGDLLAGIFAVCYHLGLTWNQLESGLSFLPQEKGRSTFVAGINEVLILDDTYNANPESMISMLQTIASLEMKHCIGVVGNLAEMDEGLKESAGYILERIPQNLTDLYLSGETGNILYPLIKKKFPNLHVNLTASVHELIEQLVDIADADTVIGIKGSRTSHMERIVYALTGNSPNCPLVRCGKLIMCRQCDEL